MRKTLIAIAAASTLALSMAAPAQAHDGFGAGVAAGLLGGAIVGGAIAASPYSYGPAYYPGPGYYGPGYVEPGYGCYWQRQRFWDGFGWRVRNVRICG